MNPLQPYSSDIYAYNNTANQQINPYVIDTDKIVKSFVGDKTNLHGTTDPENTIEPYYGASFQIAVRRFFQNYINFSGRASLSEYWWAQLFVWTVTVASVIVLLIVGQLSADDNGKLGALFGNTLLLVAGVFIVLLLPTLSVTWRRLHDANLSGAYFLLVFVPMGSFVLLIMTLMASNPAGVRFDSTY